MKRKPIVTAAFLAVMLAAIASPLTSALPVSAGEALSATDVSDQNWEYIQNDAITVAFPADGKKPMFLWWYTSDPDNINVVKFKGLIEYCTYENPYYVWRHDALASRIRERIQAKFYSPKEHMMQNQTRLRALAALWKIGNATGLHTPYLPFSSSKWRLDGPENVTRDDVRYLSFNFTLVDVPNFREHVFLRKLEIVIRCRFYYTPATEDVYGKYAYTVNAGELKIDIVVKHWDWNIDKLEPIIDDLRKLGLDIPEGKAGLALWVNLASINMTKMHVAGEDAGNDEDSDLTESVSSARSMYVEGEHVSVTPNNTDNDETPLMNKLRERFQIRFEKGNATFAGFFKFVPQAIITDGVSYNTTDVTASYVTAGAHVRLFIGYPYFGNNTFEHDPSLGVEEVVSWPSINPLLILFGATAAIAVIVAAVKLRRKTVNVLGVQ